MSFELSLNLIDLVKLHLGVHAQVPYPHLPLSQLNMVLGRVVDLEQSTTASGVLLDPQGELDKLTAVGDSVAALASDIGHQIEDVFDPAKSVDTHPPPARAARARARHRRALRTTPRVEL